jgi:hypothetical protein
MSARYRDAVARRIAASSRLAACSVVLAGLLFPPITLHAGDGELRNWFDDPFFPISHAVPDCPEPAGPRITEAERPAQSHRRAEKGTTCWLAKECDRPNAYAYDADIAAGIRAAVRERSPFSGTSLWVTVQGRVVYIEGCVARETQAAEIEAFMRAVPHVQQAIAIVTATELAPPPYRSFAPR